MSRRTPAPEAGVSAIPPHPHGRNQMTKDLVYILIGLVAMQAFAWRATMPREAYIEMINGKPWMEYVIASIIPTSGVIMGICLYHFI